jgi:hypothetical protein
VLDEVHQSAEHCRSTNSASAVAIGADTPLRSSSTTSTPSRTPMPFAEIGMKVARSAMGSATAKISHDTLPPSASANACMEKRFSPQPTVPAMMLCTNITGRVR